MFPILFAVTAAAVTVTAGFGLIALNGRGIILRALLAAESADLTGTPEELRQQYLILLEGQTYPKTYLLFRQRARISAALGRLAASPGFVPEVLPSGPSILYRNYYFAG